jgi:hypothetical protein
MHQFAYLIPHSARRTAQRTILPTIAAQAEKTGSRSFALPANLMVGYEAFPCHG